MRGLHLGKCARRILLLAPGPADEARVLTPERAGRPAAESHRRAMRRLAEVGLIELSWKSEQVETRRQKEVGPLIWDRKAGAYQTRKRQKVPVRRSIEKRATKLTPLGALLTERLRPALETGERIRWAPIIACTWEGT
jgi:hypothetical protein